MLDFKAYTKQRDIAQKRIKRAIAAGKDIKYSVPTVKDLRDMSPLDASAEMMKLNNFLKSGYSLSKEKVYSQTESAIRSRRYRRQVVAREYAREDYPTKYLEYLKGLESLGIDIPPSKLPDFFNYMDYRFGQGKKSEKIYLFDIFAEDYIKFLQAGYSTETLLDDFKKFEAHQARIEEKAGEMTGTNYEKAIKIWNKYKTNKGVD